MKRDLHKRIRRLVGSHPVINEQQRVDRILQALSTVYGDGSPIERMSPAAFNNLVERTLARVYRRGGDDECKLA